MWLAVSITTAIIALSIFLQSVEVVRDKCHFLSPSLYPSSTLHLSSNRDFDLDTSLNVDDDLLDDLGRGVKTAQNQHSPVVPLIKVPTYSIKRLWILISKVSQVLEPSPQGVFRVVTLRVLVGRRTGPLTRSSLPLARSMSSWQTFSRDWTLREVRVI